jgi:hypothetical protein
MSFPALHLSDLHVGSAGLTAARATSLAEAAAVCLEASKHRSGVTLQVIGSHPERVALHWPAVTQQQRLSNADMQDATEDGAAGLAILTIGTAKGLTVRERAIKGTGVDYWLGNDNDNDTDTLPFQNLTRLEASGILQGTPKLIAGRVVKKLAQVAPTDGVCPVYVVVVEFSSPTLHLEEK